MSRPKGRAEQARVIVRTGTVGALTDRDSLQVADIQRARHASQEPAPRPAVSIKHGCPNEWLAKAFLLAHSTVPQQTPRNLQPKPTL